MNKLSNLHYLNKLGVTPKAVRNWTPSALGSALQFWGDANAASSLTIQNQASLQTISQMNDISGNARHLTQATSTAQPRFVRGRSNLLDYSQEFNNAYWIKSEMPVTANVSIAPDGTQTADRAIPTTNNVNVHRISRTSVPVIAGVTHCYSIYMKPNSANFMKAGVGSFNNTDNWHRRYIIDFRDLSAVQETGTPSPISITPLTNGYYRVSYQATPTISTDQFFIYPCIANSVTGLDQAYVGDGVSSTDIWGAMVTEGSTLQPYIGYNGLWTDGVDDWMETPAFTLSQPFTRFSVITRQNAETNNANIFNSRTGGTNIILGQGTTNNGILMFRGTTITSGQTFSRLQTSVFGEVYNGASSVISNNGTTTTGTISAGSGSGLLIGATSSSAGFSQNIIHEVIIVSGVLPTLQRQRMEGYLAWKWGIREQFSTTHPYRHIRPTL